jgi:lipopolysaccharide biosynthesis glycosyltransferase
MAFEIPVVFAANNDYVPYLGVAISSLIFCSSEDMMYSVSILHVNITVHNQARLERLSTKNVIIHCIDVSRAMEDKQVISTNHLSVEATFRLLIAETLPQYDKVLYLDSDLVILRDVAQLYEVGLEGHVIGVAREFISVHTCDYITRLGVKFSVEEYFNSGVLLIDINRFTKRKIMEKCFELLDGETKYAYLDQDVLNIICHGDVKYLDRRWNYAWYKFSFSEPHKAYNEKPVASEPWIMHFAHGKKPWMFPGVRFADYFWEYARKTTFYEEIIYKNCQRKILPGTS